MQSFDEVVYSQWVSQKNIYIKKEFAGTGLEAVDVFTNFSGKQFKVHMYNVCRQFSKLKFLKNNLKPNEIILSVDFSRNYENKQLHEIQSAYFGHKAFTIFTCACYHVPCEEDNNKIGLKTIPIAIISNETIHERNIAFHCNQNYWRLFTIMHHMKQTLFTF